MAHEWADSSGQLLHKKGAALIEGQVCLALSNQHLYNGLQWSRYGNRDWEYDSGSRLLAICLPHGDSSEP